ncbi:hypothetical protein ACDY96_08305 [Rhizobium mongolense]|uniref:hypothetical protein n=1 Tax=Rhizobium TaxID=379 RepID=UPI0024B08955|nr:hypothetical protein [Rhizobium sp. CC1099]WFU88868.1 hypothetical protein QA644_07380 [Rhizobium sp. CC1099]
MFICVIHLARTNDHFHPLLPFDLTRANGSNWAVSCCATEYSGRGRKYENPSINRTVSGNRIFEARLVLKYAPGDVDKIKAGDEAEGVIAGLPFQAALRKAEANRTNASANHGTL